MYERYIGRCEVARQEPVARYNLFRGRETKLLFLVLSLVFLGIASLIVALFIHLVMEQKV